MSKVIYELGDDISTDIIYPGRFMATVLPTETPQFAFVDLKDLNKMLVNKEVPEGSIILANKNFGCGSSREQAVSCLKGHNVVIIAKNFPTIEAKLGDEIAIEGDKVVNKTTGKSFETIPHHPSRQAIIDAGGLIAFTRKRLMEM